MPICRTFLLALVALLLGACQSNPQADDPVQPGEFSLRDVAKGDIDMVAEVSVRQTRDYLQALARKLYLRNPNQLARSENPQLDAAQAAAALFDPQGAALTQLQGKRAAEAVALAFDEDFAGDRVAAFISGLNSMTLDAYGGEGDFYLHHEYDPQKLYHLARNFEIAAWRLRNARDAQGQLFLLSSLDGNGVANLSFERLTGKLIALQDHFAYVVADTTNRRIKNVIQGVASAVFFPI